jgi:hypothetical protein
VALAASPALFGSGAVGLRVTAGSRATWVVAVNPCAFVGLHEMDGRCVLSIRLLFACALPCAACPSSYLVNQLICTYHIVFIL